MSDNELPPLPALPGLQRTVARPDRDVSDEGDDGDVAGTQEEVAQAPRLAVRRPLRARASIVSVPAESEDGSDAERAQARKVVKEARSQTYVCQVTDHGFSVLAASKGSKLGKGVSELLEAINTNARVSERLAADTVPTNLDVSRAEIAARLDDLDSRVDAIADVSQPGEDGPSAAVLAALLAGVRKTVDEHDRYVRKLAELCNKTNDEVVALRADVVRLTAEADAQKIRMTVLATSDPLPALPPLASGSTPARRPRSPGNALVVSAAKRKKVGESSSKVVPAISFGPWRGALTSAVAPVQCVLDFINSLPNCRELVLPYAATSEATNKSFVVGYFKLEEERDRVLESCIESAPDRFRGVQGEAVDLPSPPNSALVANSSRKR